MAQMHDRNTTASPRWRFPWKLIIAGVIILLALVSAAAFLGTYGALRLYASTDTVSTSVVPESIPVVVTAKVSIPNATVPETQQPAIQPVVQPVQQVHAVVPAVPNPQVPQNVDNVAAAGAVAPVVVDYRVVWTKVQGFDPSTIPVEEGLYNGDAPNTYLYIPGDPMSLPASALYALEVFPELWMWNARETPGILTAIARDATDKRVVFLAVRTHYNEKEEDGGFRREVRIALSVNGGEVWCKLNVLPRGVDGATFHVRIHAQQISVNLYALDTRSGVDWWTATVDKNTLPCS